MLRIKEILKQKGVTQDDLAFKMGVSRTALNRSINGNPTLETISKIATVLDVDVRALFNPTKESEHLPIYTKHKDEFVYLGTLNADILKSLFDE